MTVQRLSRRKRAGSNQGQSSTLESNRDRGILQTDTKPRRNRRCRPCAALCSSLAMIFVNSSLAQADNQALQGRRASRQTRIVDRNLFEDPSCRCEYPGEDYYGEEFEDYVTVDNVKILPQSHEACQDVLFVCPGQEANGSVAWSYDCSEFAEVGAHRRAQLRGQRSLDAIKRHDFSTLVTALRTPQQEVVLPSEDDSCAPSISCTDKQLTFDKARNGRPLKGGSMVQNEFLHNYGVKITAQSQSDSKTVHPMLFDTENTGSNGITIPEISSLGSPNVDCTDDASGIGDGGMVGRSGENCEPLGNVLIAKKVGLPTEEDQYGVLTFEFDDEVEVFYEIGFLNILGSNSSVVFYQENRPPTITPLMSVGQNGLLKIVPSNLRNVKKMVVDMQSFSAVTHLKFCSNGP